MSDYGSRTSEEDDGPVPRDLPDQQVRDGEDPWDVEPAAAGWRRSSDEDAAESEQDTDAADVPDTDEAGTGRQGAAHTGTVHPEDPGPEESPD